MKLNLKHRHFLSAAGNIRLRYVVTIAAFFVAMISALIFWEKPEETTTITVARAMIIPADQAEITDDTAAAAPTTPLSKKISYNPEDAGNGITPFLTRIGLRPILDEAYPWTSTITVQSGDSLGLLMEETGLKGNDYVAALSALKEHIDPRDIRPGQEIRVTKTRIGERDIIEKIAYNYDSLSSITLRKNAETWVAQKQEKPMETKIHAAKTVIDSSIYGSLGRVGVPDGIVNRMIQAYSWTVDFQRDIWGGEEVELLYETRETPDGEYVRSNRLLYANLRLRNRNIPIYLYEKDKGFPNYFEPSGQSIRRALMKTPVDGARISSGWGMRRHPVLGYNKMHKGLDFAAPTGTPIYAAGDGVVERANRFSSYGNYIRIRHNDTYKTAYAHLHGFAKGIKAGTRVKQGQVIGYVGSTGRSTGPHLHYEVIKNGKQVNPHSVDLPLGEELKGPQLASFQRQIIQFHDRFAAITGVQPNQRNFTTLPPRKPDEIASNADR